jgi:2-iminoacetate synthase
MINSSDFPSDNFINLYNQYSWNEVQESIYSKTKMEVLQALGKSKRDLEDFKALISPAANLILSKWQC